MKIITKKELESLIESGYLRRTSDGLVNRYGKHVGYYRAKTKRYIEDKYADIAKNRLAHGKNKKQ